MCFNDERKKCTDDYGKINQTPRDLPTNTKLPKRDYEALIKQTEEEQTLIGVFSGFSKVRC